MFAPGGEVGPLIHDSVALLTGPRTEATTGPGPQSYTWHLAGVESPQATALRNGPK